MKLAPFGHLVGFDAQVLHDDLFHPLGNVTHRSNLVLFRLGARPELRLQPSRYGLVVVDAGETIPDRGDTFDLRHRAAPAGPNSGYHTSKSVD